MDKAPYSVKIESNKGKTTITFSGQLIINHINKITNQINDELAFNENLEIIIEQIDNIDVTFIQLLFVLKNTFSKENKEVKITANLKEELKVLVDNSGFNLLLN